MGSVAGNVMIGALVAVIIVGFLEYFYWRKRDKEARENTELLKAIAKKWVLAKLNTKIPS